MVEPVTTVVSIVALAALGWQWQNLKKVDLENLHDFTKNERRVSALSGQMDVLGKEVATLRQTAAKKASVREAEGMLAEAIAELVGGGKPKARMPMSAKSPSYKGVVHVKVHAR